MLFLHVIKHTAAECLTHNETVRKVTFEAFSQIEELTKKHGIKIVGSWQVHAKHFNVTVYDAPNFEALLAYSLEPAIAKMMGFYTSDLWVAEAMPDVMQRLMQAQ